MKRTIAQDFGVEYPIFAFSHCRDVVAEVSRRGGFGVLGAAGFTPEQLDMELRWIDEHAGGKPYGVDLLMPARSADTGTRDAQKLAQELAALVPQRHREFARQVLRENGIETRPLDAPFLNRDEILMTQAHTRPLVDVTLAHPKVKLFVSALGPPPADVVGELKSAGVKIGALAGSKRHAERHIHDGVDIIVAQGTEAGGHTGEITTMVLVPEVVDAVSPAPVLAAGGIGTGRQMAAAMALGAQGVWTGSIWLTVSEANTSPEDMQDLFAAGSSDTIRSRCKSGKPIRQLRSKWTDAWGRPDAPATLEMPLQRMLFGDAAADESARRQAMGLTRAVVGQIVGQMNDMRPTGAVLQELVEEFIETIGGLAEITQFESEAV
jgi:NAD(P)H-dependent flavin oxidoreductase YrpB (nitropropane dioxygenase family)